MKRYNQLFEQLTSFENLYIASKKAQLGKRYKGYVLVFNVNLESNLIQLQKELITKTYKPGIYTKFSIYDPVKREISSAPYRDRVIHHALCNIIEPIFEKVFIYDSYANRIDKGTHKAVLRYQQFAKKNKYVLKCDIRKYFPSIDHEILKGIIRKKIKDKHVLWLIDLIIDNSNLQETVTDYFPNDTLFTPFERRKGIPIGNLTSQFFANIYLNELDHYIKETLDCKYYIRYVDDFVIFKNNKQELWNVKMKIKTMLYKLRLSLHPIKVKIYRVDQGVKFLGYKVFPHYIHLKTENIQRFLKRMKAYRVALRKGGVQFEKVKQSVMSWIGYSKLVDNRKFINSVLVKAWV